jgi:hypothetical protein
VCFDTIGVEEGSLMQRSSRRSARFAGVGIAIALVASACADENPSVTGPSGSSGGGGSTRVKLEAVVSARTGTCPAIRFTLGAIRVETNSSTQFEISCDRVVDGAAVEADASRMTGAVLLAREVDRGDESVSDPDFDVEGPIDALSGSGDCTATAGRDVTVLGFAFVAGTFTDFRNIPNDCSGLTVGTTIRARGRLTNPPATPTLPLRATRVERP